MGAHDSEDKSRENERPRHKVNIQPFAIGRYEVTFEEWDVCVVSGGCTYEPSDKGWGRGRRPVINVSRVDAQQYIDWLSQKTGEIYRLPSEAEWEYAARAFPTSIDLTVPAYIFGDVITKHQANFAGSLGQTAEVGSYPSNIWGLHDMHGNVWEWGADDWHDNYIDAPVDGATWHIGGGTTSGVLRGGSWTNAPSRVRSAVRIEGPTGHRSSTIGFRLARTLAH